MSDDDHQSPARKMGEREKDKRPARISSSAFSFSLGTPAKKVKAAPHASEEPSPRRPEEGISSPRHAPLTTPRHIAQPRTGRKESTPQRSTVTIGQHAQAVSSLSPFTPSRAKPDLGALPSPFALNPLPPASKDSTGPSRRLNAVLEDTTFRRLKDERRKQGITSMPKPSVDEARAQAVVQEEDIGVSPRRTKAIQHRGPGPPPSVRLSSLISANSTSLVLFYTSLQHTLSRQTKVYYLQHIQTAALHVRTTSAAPIPSHATLLLECEVLTLSGATSGEHPKVMVVFQALPTDCPRVGIDPRVVCNSDKRFEVGIWAPYSEVMLPHGRKAVFAGRFLIAEAA